MKALTPEGREQVASIASKYNLQKETVEAVMLAVIQGNGTMAQFNIPELGGSGQWMRGGMTMVGDMFNSSLRTTVDKLCNELSDLVTSRVLFEEKTEEVRTEKSASIGYTNGSSWPAVFGQPTSSGAQNNFRYAYFAPVHRLVIEENGKRTIYDTKHHHITGVSQQQGATSTHQFTSQDGIVDLRSLTIVSEPGEPMQPTPEIAYDVTSTPHAIASEAGRHPQDTIIATIEKVNVLFEKGQISEEEFRAKKKELLEKL